MGIARSTFYDDPSPAHDDTAIVEAMARDLRRVEFYGWRRVRGIARLRDESERHKSCGSRQRC